VSNPLFPSSDEQSSDRGVTPNLAQIDPPDNAGRIVVRIVVAAIVVSAFIAAYFYFGQQKPVAAGAVTHIDLFPIHSVMGAPQGGAGTVAQAEQYDQLIVFAHVDIHNQSNAPLSITEVVGNVTLADSSQPTSPAVGKHDVDRLVSAYPKVASLRSAPLLNDIVIAPGATASGLLIFNYSMSTAQWDQRKVFDLSVSFSNGTVVHIDGTHV
jgi:hypothetical protein